jgi:hypothetical protein
MNELLPKAVAAIATRTVAKKTFILSVGLRSPYRRIKQQVRNDLDVEEKECDGPEKEVSGFCSGFSLTNFNCLNVIIIIAWHQLNCSKSFQNQRIIKQGNE